VDVESGKWKVARFRISHLSHVHVMFTRLYDFKYKYKFNNMEDVNCILKIKVSASS